MLEEHGYKNVQRIWAKCPKFKCEKDVDHCCWWRMLYNEPDFVGVESLLETHWKSHGHGVIFLPKFHCELNFIEQCWGYAKCVYCLYPGSPKEADLKWNVLSSLNSVPLESMCWYAQLTYKASYDLKLLFHYSYRFSTQSCCFMDGYRKGLNGRQAAWASKKYCGHCMLPESILVELDNAQVV